MNRVVSANELQIWRSVSNEEAKVIQGIIRKEAKDAKRSSIIINSLLAFYILVLPIEIILLVNCVFVALERKDSYGVFALISLIIGISLIIFILGKSLFKSLRIKLLSKKDTQPYYETIKPHLIKAVDVQIEEIIFQGELNRGKDYINIDCIGNIVKVKDRYDTYCDTLFMCESYNGCQKTKAILFEVPIFEEEDGISIMKVIPCKEYDPRLWSIGLKNYN